MLKRALSLILALLMLLGLCACGGGETEGTAAGTGAESETEGTGTEPEVSFFSESEQAYLDKYADNAKAEAWIKANITEAAYPPVNFAIGRTNSSSLKWTKSISEKTSVVDYEGTDMPAQRSFYTVTFECEEYGLAVDVLVTEYPGYPVVDYEATLRNTKSENSEVVRNLYSIYGNIYETSEKVNVLYYNGSTEIGDNDKAELCDYVEKTHTLKAGGKSLKLEVANGKPTSDYLPNLVMETESGDGLISILSWQGSWKQELSYTNGKGVSLAGGQYKTQFNLLGNETHRFPEMVLIFFKEGQEYGQNIYRRWFWKHNFMREEGFRYTTNVLFSTGVPADDSLMEVQSTEKYDLTALRAVKAFMFEDEVERFAQDAGWTVYKKPAIGWFNAAGTWEIDSARYPNGLKKVSDTAKDLGLGYTLWMEPERATKGQDLGNEHPEWMIHYREQNGKKVYAGYNNVGKGNSGLVNIGDKACLEYVLNMINTIIKEQGVTVYRNDFNFFPAPYWEAYDAEMTKELGISRTGRTEEMYCNGYLALFDGIIAANPGINIDACASGGMRYDLATARRAHCHTRTDWFGSAEKAQSDTYTTSKWMVYWGGAFDYKSDYGTRSRISSDVGIGVSAREGYDYETYFKEIGAKLLDWRSLSSYLYEDYYPLTEYKGQDDKGLIAFQYDCPSKGGGIVIGFVRSEGVNENLKPYALDENATYEWYDIDDPDTVNTATGKELMEKGFNFKSVIEEPTEESEGGFVKTAPVYVYTKK